MGWVVWVYRSWSKSGMGTPDWRRAQDSMVTSNMAGWLSGLNHWFVEQLWKTGCAYEIGDM